MTQEQKLENAVPWIKWREPVPIMGENEAGDVVHGLGCRFCIAMYGLKGSEVVNLPQTPVEFAEHMKEYHK